MTTDDRSKMMDKIAKLLALASDQGATKGEAIAAGNKAAELLRTYQIEQHELRPADLKQLTASGIVQKHWPILGRNKSWQRSMISFVVTLEPAVNGYRSVRQSFRPAWRSPGLENCSCRFVVFDGAWMSAGFRDEISLSSQG